MSVTMTGAEFKRFYEAPHIWGSTTYHDDTRFLVNGVYQEDGIEPTSLKDTDRVCIECGTIYEIGGTVREADLLETALDWLVNQNTVYLSVECNKSLQAAVTAAIIAAGGKVVS